VSDAGSRLGTAGPELGSLDWWRERSSLALRRRPRSDGLSLERILAAALHVLDEEGLEALTMRRLADELGAAPASLYRHVANREELLVEVVDSALAGIRPPPHPSSWRAGSQWLAREFNRLLVDHPSLVVLVPGDRLQGPNACRAREMALKTLLQRGFPADDAAVVYGMIVGWVLGHATLASSVTMRSGDGLRSVRAVVRNGRTAQAVESFTALGTGPLFELGLETLLDGIQVRYGVEP
jgi:AcrR family transcriptional regulator